MTQLMPGRRRRRGRDLSTQGGGSVGFLVFLFVPALAAGVLAEQAARVLSPIVTAVRAVAVVAQPRLASEAGHAADANAPLLAWSGRQPACSLPV